MTTIKQKIDRTIDLAQKATKDGYKELLLLIHDPNNIVRFNALETITEVYTDYISEKDIKFLVNDSFSRIAVMACVSLVFDLNIMNDQIFKRCLKLLHETKDELLLVDIIEVLSEYPHENIKKSDINHVITHKSPLVRRYLFSLLGDIFEKKKLLELLRQERSLRVKVGIYHSLGNIDELIRAMLSSKHHHVICFCLHSLSEHVTKNNKERILNSFLKLRKKIKKWNNPISISEILEESISSIKERV